MQPASEYMAAHANYGNPTFRRKAKTTLNHVFYSHSVHYTIVAVKPSFIAPFFYLFLYWECRHIFTAPALSLQETKSKIQLFQPLFLWCTMNAASAWMVPGRQGRLLNEIRIAIGDPNNFPWEHFWEFFLVPWEPEGISERLPEIFSKWVYINFSCRLRDPAQLVDPLLTKKPWYSLGHGVLNYWSNMFWITYNRNLARHNYQWKGFKYSFAGSECLAPYGILSLFWWNVWLNKGDDQHSWTSVIHLMKQNTKTIEMNNFRQNLLQPRKVPRVKYWSNMYWKTYNRNLASHNYQWEDFKFSGSEWPTPLDKCHPYYEAEHENNRDVSQWPKSWQDSMERLWCDLHLKWTISDRTSCKQGRCHRWSPIKWGGWFASAMHHPCPTPTPLEQFPAKLQQQLW